MHLKRINGQVSKDQIKYNDGKKVRIIKVKTSKKRKANEAWKLNQTPNGATMAGTQTSSLQDILAGVRAQVNSAIMNQTMNIGGMTSGALGKKEEDALTDLEYSNTFADWEVE